MVLIALVAGALGIVGSLALRRNTPRARSLRQSKGIADERMVLLLLPGISMFLFGAGLFGVILPGVGGAFGTLGGVLLLLPAAVITIAGGFFTVMGILPGPVPNWVKPQSDR